MGSISQLKLMGVYAYISHHYTAVHSTSNRISTEDVTGGKGWPPLKADNLTAICQSIVYEMWKSLWPITGMTLLFSLATNKYIFAYF